MLSDFTINQSSLIANSWVHTLRGTKSAAIVAMTLNGDANAINLLTAVTWQADVILFPGDNVFQIQGTDTSNNVTEVMEVTVTLRSHSPEIFEIFNDIGKLGLAQGLRRLAGEKNIYFLRRIQEAPYYPSGADYAGLREAIARDLGLTTDRNAFSVAIAKDTYLNPVSESLTLEITPSAVLVDADELVIDDEAHCVDPAFNGFYLNHEPRYESDVELFTRDRTKIDEKQYRVHRYERKVVFETADFNRTWIRTRYNYREEISVNGTLTHLATDLEALRIRGLQALTVTVQEGGRRAEWLAHRTRIVLTTAAETLNWVAIQIYNLPEQRFRDSLLNTHGAAYLTKLEAWAKAIAKRSKFGWQAVILDVDTWDPLYKTRNNAVLPHLFDSYRGHWSCADPTDSERYNWSAYVGYGGYCPNHPSEPLTYTGVKDSEWHSGIGDGDDLKVTGIKIQ